MKSQEALRAALASLHLVDDVEDVKRLRAPLKEFQESCPFIEFKEDSAHDLELDYLSDSAHVFVRANLPEEGEITPGKGGTKKRRTAPPAVDSFQIRRLQKAAGRNTFCVPAKRLEYTCTVPFLQSFFRSEQQLSEIGDDLPDILGRGLTHTIEIHMLYVLMAAAEGRSNGVVKTDKQHVFGEVRKALETFKCPATVIAGAAITTEITRDSRFGEDRMRVGAQGQVHLTGRISEEIALVVAHQPKKVGMVRIRFEPEMAVVCRNSLDGVGIAAGEFGFFTWGDAPVVKFDLRNS